MSFLIFIESIFLFVALISTILLPKGDLRIKPFYFIRNEIFMLRTVWLDVSTYFDLLTTSSSRSNT